MSSPLRDPDDDPFKDVTPPWLLRREKSLNNGNDGDEETTSIATTLATPTSLLDLNRDCLTTILSALPPASIASAALSCSLIADVAKTDALWRMKALEDFGAKTDVDAWTRRGVVKGRRERRRARRRRRELRRGGQGGGGRGGGELLDEGEEAERERDDERAAEAAPETYLCLYRLLSRLDRLVGLWRDDSLPCHAQALAERRARWGRGGGGGGAAGKTPRNNSGGGGDHDAIASRPGDLVAFSFSSRSLVGHRLSFKKPRGGQPRRVEVARLSPCSAAAAAEVVEAGRCVLRRRTSSSTGGGGGGGTPEGGRGSRGGGGGGRSPSALSGSPLPPLSGLRIGGGSSSSAAAAAAGRARRTSAANASGSSPSPLSLLPSLALGSSPSSTSAAASAAAVAVGAVALDVASLAAAPASSSRSSSSPMLGSSPVLAGSFEFEMLRFLGTSIRGGAAGGGGRAAAARRAARELAERGGVATHLTRISVPRPSRAHPLAGL